jgi:DNA-binding response OmpR family regulator
MEKILIIDGQKCIRQLFTEELSRERYRVTSVGDSSLATEGIDWPEIDLIILDLYLDGPEGFKVLEDIKLRNPELPVIIVTAYDGFIEDPRLQKADGYVVKSVDLIELKEKVRQVLGKTPVHQRRITGKSHCSNMAFGVAL